MNKYTKPLSDWLDKVQESLFGPSHAMGSTWADSARGVYASLLEGLRGHGGDMLIKTSQRFDEAIPYIEQAGYDVTEIEVGVGLSPRIVPHLKVREILDTEDQMKLLKEVRHKRMVYTILNSLFKATTARKALRFQNYHFTEIEMELALLPTVVLRFRKDGTSLRSAKPDELVKAAEELGLVPEPESTSDNGADTKKNTKTAKPE